MTFWRKKITCLKYTNIKKTTGSNFKSLDNRF